MKSGQLLIISNSGDKASKYDKWWGGGRSSFEAGIKKARPPPAPAWKVKTNLVCKAKNHF